MPPELEPKERAIPLELIDSTWSSTVIPADGVQWKINSKQAGAELCQAQTKLGLAMPTLPRKLRWASILKDVEVVYR